MPRLPEAVASLAAQGVPLEIVIVHSATGVTDDPEWLPRGARYLPEVQLLPTGAARNAGIAATRAPWIAFLAGHEWALPGWASGRLESHREGSTVVSGALVNGNPSSLVAWAAHVVLHHRRWPRVPSHEALRYGCSYARSVLERFGGFRDDLAAGEDTELNGRLEASGSMPAWVPTVRNALPYATDPRELMRDQARRGARAARSWLALDDLGRAIEVGRRPLTRASRALRFALRYAEPADRSRVALSAPLVAIAAASYARGARAAISASAAA